MLDSCHAGPPLSVSAGRDAHAVVARVAAADDDDVLALGRDVVVVVEVRVEERLRASVRVVSDQLGAHDDEQQQGRRRERVRTLVFCWRNSMAKWMPPSSRFFILRSRGQVAPVAMMSASFSARMSCTSCVLPT